MTVVHPGRPYINDQICHTFQLESRYCTPWDKAHRDYIKGLIEKVSGVKKCHPAINPESYGRFDVIIRSSISDQQHREILSQILTVLQRNGMHNGSIHSAIGQLRA